MYLISDYNQNIQKAPKTPETHETHANQLKNGPRTLTEISPQVYE